MEDITDVLPQPATDTDAPEVAVENESDLLHARITNLGLILTDVMERVARLETFLHTQYNDAVVHFDARLKAVEMMTPEATNAELEATVEKLCEKMKFLVPMD